MEQESSSLTNVKKGGITGDTTGSSHMKEGKIYMIHILMKLNIMKFLILTNFVFFYFNCFFDYFNYFYMKIVPLTNGE